MSSADLRRTGKITWKYSGGFYAGVLPADMKKKIGEPLKGQNAERSADTKEEIGGSLMGQIAVCS